MLPKITAPIYQVVQPSTGEEINIRPFLVKEEKLLLTAKESGDSSDIYGAIKQIINNCVLKEDFDVNDIPIFDMEYFFIKLRSISVSPVVKFKVQDSSDGIEYDLEVNLEEVEVQFPENHDRKVMISDDVGIMMKYPTPSISDKLKEATTELAVTTTTIDDSIDYVFDLEDTYEWKTASEKEREEFLDSLSIDAYKKIQQFYESSPQIEHVVSYTNSEGKEKKVIFRDLSDFFMLG